MSKTDWVGIVKNPSAKIDPLLEPLLRPASDQQAEQFLSQLIMVHAEPVIKGVIRHKLHLPSYDATGQTDASDLGQEAVVQLLAKLRQFREQPYAHPISDVCGLAAVIAHRACSRWMRRQFPERHALKNRLYYLLTHQKGFRLWQNSGKKLVAGFAVWRGQTETVSDERFQRLLADERLIAQLRQVAKGRPQRQGRTDTKDQKTAATPSAVLAAIFDHLGSPIEFDKLVSGLAALLPINDQLPGLTAEGEHAVGLAATEAPDPAWQVEKRIFLHRLWEEVRRLPLNQRAALLLNLKDAEGGGCIGLFPATGVATFRQLAETLHLAAEKFAELWNELPLEDSRIAELLQLTRQQVINARKSARERLTRQLKGFI